MTTDTLLTRIREETTETNSAAAKDSKSTAMEVDEEEANGDEAVVDITGILTGAGAQSEEGEDEEGEQQAKNTDEEGDAEMAAAEAEESEATDDESDLLAKKAAPKTAAKPKVNKKPAAEKKKKVVTPAKNDNLKMASEIFGPNHTSLGLELPDSPVYRPLFKATELELLEKNGAYWDASDRSSKPVGWWNIAFYFFVYHGYLKRQLGRPKEEFNTWAIPDQKISLHDAQQAAHTLWYYPAPDKVSGTLIGSNLDVQIINRMRLLVKAIQEDKKIDFPMGFAIAKESKSAPKSKGEIVWKRAKGHREVPIRDALLYLDPRSIKDVKQPKRVDLATVPDVKKIAGLDWTFQTTTQTGEVGTQGEISIFSRLYAVMNYLAFQNLPREDPDVPSDKGDQKKGSQKKKKSDKDDDDEEEEEDEPSKAKAKSAAKPKVKPTEKAADPGNKKRKERNDGDDDEEETVSEADQVPLQPPRKKSKTVSKRALASQSDDEEDEKQAAAGADEDGDAAMSTVSASGDSKEAKPAKAAPKPAKAAPKPAKAAPKPAKAAPKPAKAAAAAAPVSAEAKDEQPWTTILSAMFYFGPDMEQDQRMAIPKRLWTRFKDALKDSLPAKETLNAQPLKVDHIKLLPLIQYFKQLQVVVPGLCRPESQKAVGNLIDVLDKKFNFPCGQTELQNIASLFDIKDPMMKNSELLKALKMVGKLAGIAEDEHVIMRTLFAGEMARGFMSAATEQELVGNVVEAMRNLQLRTWSKDEELGWPSAERVIDTLDLLQAFKAVLARNDQVVLPDQRE